jgi:hypothetical protein
METEEIDRKLRALNYTLIAVLALAALSFVLGMFYLLTAGHFSLAIFLISFVGFIASLPVYLEKRKLKAIQADKKKDTKDDW